MLCLSTVAYFLWPFFKRALKFNLLIQCIKKQNKTLEEQLFKMTFSGCMDVCSFAKLLGIFCFLSHLSVFRLEPPLHIHNQAFSLILTFSFLSSDVTNLHALMDLVHSCPAWGPMDVCVFISLTLLPSFIVSFPLWVEYRSAAGHWSRHFLLLSKGIKVSWSRTESLHYYLINLPRTSDFSFLDWREKLSRVMFSLSTGTGQSCFQTQRACSPAILIRTQPPAPGSAHLCERQWYLEENAT